MVVGTVGDSTSGQSRSESVINGDSSDALSESVGDSSLLGGGREIEMQFRVLICNLPCSLVKAASLYVIGNLG